MKVIFLGLRGFPKVQGGVESHCQSIAPLLVSRGLDVEVIVRSGYQLKQYREEWSGIKFTSLWAPKSKKFEAIFHSILGVAYAAIKRPDVLHIHAIGPSLVTPLARFFGLRVVVTNHGPDYEREKWGRLAKFFLRLGERFGAVFSNKKIVISNAIKLSVEEKYGVETKLIPNGVAVPQIATTHYILGRFGLEASRYVLMVGRLVPEKRHFDVISAFSRAAPSGWKLVIVGNTEHPDLYSDSIYEAAKSNDSLVLTGFLSGRDLHEVYSHAGIFILPSSHEGLPIALLESMAYGLPILASDILANREVGLPSDCYFALGDVRGLSLKIQSTVEALGGTRLVREDFRRHVKSDYDWRKIAEETHALYQSVVG